MYTYNQIFFSLFSTYFYHNTCNIIYIFSTYFSNAKRDKVIKNMYFVFYPKKKCVLHVKTQDSTLMRICKRKKCKRGYMVKRKCERNNIVKKRKIYKTKKKKMKNV